MGLIEDFLILIPGSAIPVILIIFVSNVLMRMELAFLVYWKWSYLILFSLAAALQLGRLIQRYFLFLKTAKKLGRPYSVIEQAVLEFEFNKIKPVKDWTNEWLANRLVIHDLALSLAKSMIKSLRN